jgi:hypothetical protein
MYDTAHRTGASTRQDALWRLAGPAGRKGKRARRVPVSDSETVEKSGAGRWAGDGLEPDEMGTGT